MEDLDETPRELNEIFQAMLLSGPDAVSIEEVRASFQRTTMLDDDDLINEMAESFFRSASIKVSQEETMANRENSNTCTDSKEKKGRQQQNYGTPTDTPIPSGEANPHDNDDVTPTTNNGTPMSFSTTGAKTPTPSETVRRRGRDRSRSRSTNGSRSRTPMGSFFRSMTPERSAARMRSRSPAARSRSQSPLLRFFGSNGKPDSPEHARGATPNRSGLPLTPVRANESETFAAKTADSHPVPPTTTGNAFGSPSPSNLNSSWTRRQVPPDAAPTTATQQTMPPPTARPEFHANIQPNVHPAQPQFNAPPVQPNVPPPVHANIPAPAPPNVGIPQVPPQNASQMPVMFNVSLPSKPKGAKRRPGGRRGKDKHRPQRAGGPEKSTTQQAVPPVDVPPPFEPRPGVTRSFSVDSGLQGHDPTKIFIDATPSFPGPQGNSSAPEQMETSPEANPHAANDLPQQTIFSIGTTDKKTSLGRSKRNTVHRRQKSKILPRTTPSKPIKSPEVCANPSGDSAESSGGQTLRTESTCSSEVDYTGRKALVSSLRDEARNAYTKHDYRGAVSKYTATLKVHVSEPTPGMNQSDDLRAVLLGNRAAALLMMNAFDAASADCQSALKYVSDLHATPVTLVSDAGPVLRAKLFARMGKALLRSGKLQEAEQAFYNTVNTAHAILVAAHEIGFSEETEQTKRFLTQLITDAESGKIEVNRCREAAEEIAKFGNVVLGSPTPSARRNNMQALLFVNKALEFAPGAVAFHEKKVALLASLKRWRELAGYCERVAALHTQFDGLFEDDLAQFNPFPGVPKAEALKTSLFEANDPVESSTTKLGTRAAAEAVLRLPHSLLAYYLRSLRLEERWAQAYSAINSLERFIQAGSDLNHQSVRSKFAWLSQEKDKLNRTSAGKERGDSLFRNGEYNLAAAQYTCCLTIDAEGVRDGELGEVSNAGGRLHAILHCNRAACLMALKKYHEAVTDCTSALRIHSHYMKAMLRRSRCYMRLQRYEEAIVEFSRWIELVVKAKSSANNQDLSTTPCLFDSPKEIPDDELSKVKHELEDLKRAKRAAESSARSESNFDSSSQQYYQESFGRSGSSSNAQNRRDQWYNQKASSSRRWDSFAGRSPKRTGNKSGQQQQRSQSSRFYHEQHSYSQRERFNSSNSSQQNRQAQGSPGSDASLDHYAVLGIPRNATESQIKKAFRKVCWCSRWLHCSIRHCSHFSFVFLSQLALKYHPDKNDAPEAAATFRRIKLAYETLNDSALRRKYDAELTRRF